MKWETGKNLAQERKKSQKKTHEVKQKHARAKKKEKGEKRGENARRPPPVKKKGSKAQARGSKPRLLEVIHDSWVLPW